MGLAAHVDGRTLDFDYEAGRFTLDGSSVTPESVVLADGEGLLRWGSDQARLNWLSWIDAVALAGAGEPAPAIGPGRASHSGRWPRVTKTTGVLVASVAVLLAATWYQSGGPGGAAVAVILSAIPTMVFLYVLWRVAGWAFDDVPSLVTGFVFASSVTVLATVVIGTLLSRDQMTQTTITGPIIEEIAKATTALWVLSRVRQPDRRAAFTVLVFVMVGFGFSFGENVLALSNTMRSGAAEVVATWAVRGWLFGLGHSVFAGVSGAAYALGLNKSQWRRLALPLGVLAATLIHMAWNFSISVGFPWLVYFGIILPLVMAGYVWARRARPRLGV